MSYYVDANQTDEELVPIIVTAPKLKPGQFYGPGGVRGKDGRLVRQYIFKRLYPNNECDDSYIDQLKHDMAVDRCRLLVQCLWVSFINNAIPHGLNLLASACHEPKAVRAARQRCAQVRARAVVCGIYDDRFLAVK